MGCDIHMMVQYRQKQTNDEPVQWRSMFNNSINPGRNYRLFGRMVKGLRVDDPNGFEPRGLPEDSINNTLFDWEMKYNYCYMVVDNENDCNGEGQYCTLDTAERWVKSGSSKWIEENRWVSGPDWHSESWLTFKEFEECLDDVTFDTNGSFPPDPKYFFILAGMRELEKSFDTRIVFWFDN